MEEDRYKLALAALERSSLFFHDMKLFELTQEHSIELIKLGAARGCVRKALEQVKIEDENLRLQIALDSLLCEQYNEDFSCFEIHDSEKKKKLADAIVENHKLPILALTSFKEASFDLYSSIDQAIDKDTFKMKDLKVIAGMHFSQNQLYSLLEKGITRLANETITWWYGNKLDLLTCGIQDVLKLKELCKLSAAYPGFIHCCLEKESFNWTEDEIIEFLMKILEKFPQSFKEAYSKVKIEKYEQKMQLAEAFVQHCSDCPVALFGIEGEEDKKKVIALQAAAGHLKITNQLFKYGIKDNAFLLDILSKVKNSFFYDLNELNCIFEQQFTHLQLKQITKKFIINNTGSYNVHIELLKLFQEEEQFEIIYESSSICSFKVITINFSDEYKRKCIQSFIDNREAEHAIGHLLSLKAFHPISDALSLKKCLIFSPYFYNIAPSYEKKLITLPMLMDIVLKKASQKKVWISSLSGSLGLIYNPNIEKETQQKFSIKLLLSQIGTSTKKWYNTLSYLQKQIGSCFPEHQHLLGLPRKYLHLSARKTTKKNLFPDDIVPISLKALATSIEGIENPYLKKNQTEWFIRILATAFLSPSLHYYTKHEKLQAVLNELYQLRNPNLKEHVTGVFIRTFFNGKKGCSVKRKYLFNLLQTIRPNAYLAAIVLLSWWSKVPLDKIEHVVRLISKKRTLMKDVIKRKLLLESLVSIMSRTKLSKEKTIDVIAQIISHPNIKRVLNDLNLLAGIMNYEWEENELDFSHLDQVVMNLVFKDVHFAENEKEGLIDRYGETFGKYHHPHAIIIYSANHQKSDENVKEVIGRYIKSILFQTISTDRYKLEGNIHLLQIFGNNPEKLVKWRNPMNFIAEDVVNLKEFSTPKERISFKDFYIEKILHFKHLGKNQDIVYPELIRGLLCSEGERKHIIDVLKERLKKEAVEDMGILTMLKLSYEVLASLDLTFKVDKACELLKKMVDLVPQHLEFYNDLKVYRNQLKNPLKFSLDDLTFKICDDSSDLMQCGTDVGSCQRYEGDPFYNKCLPAYLLDGKYLIGEVKNNLTGKILGRAMLRLLWDKENETGVIHLEKVYSTVAEEFMKSAINKMCIKFAAEVGFDLVTSTQTKDKYPHTLYSLDSPAPYEYVDGIKGIRSKTYEIVEIYYLKEEIKA